MSVSRWKVMAGVLGVSLGGLAAMAGQCPKPGEHRVQRSDDRVDVPKVIPPAGAGRPAPTTPLDLPALPAPTTPEPLKLPEVPPPAVSPRAVVVPAVSGEAKMPPMTPPMMPPSAPVVPVSSSTPPVPVTPSAPTPVEFVKPVPSPNVPPPVVSGPEVVVPTVVATPPAPPPAQVQPQPQPVTTAAPPVIQPTISTTTKFRIILRVGEGEPMFEVRSGDDLVMKVICEKVDVKSPERGQSLSAVTASGKVRFVGFGSEGSCDSLSFLAGTGEVSMSGNVKIQVKDKLGRVESELTTDSIKYRIDTSALPGSLKP